MPSVNEIPQGEQILTIAFYRRLCTVEEAVTIGGSSRVLDEASVIVLKN
jgi:hypothetical protein